MITPFHPFQAVPPQSRIPLSPHLQSCPLQRPWQRMPVPHSAQTQGPVFNTPERATTVNGRNGETARHWESAALYLSYLPSRGTNPCRPAGCMAPAIGAAGVLQERGPERESTRGKGDQVCSRSAAILVDTEVVAKHRARLRGLVGNIWILIDSTPTKDSGWPSENILPDNEPEFLVDPSLFELT
ncbi:hypothetical protein ASPSYDRAFT_738533 [Aspergillus sydowii CBS 593.65]|jgi:hypothetical protein|uniref:Uncharacterized protein n=1 Tax=Aspergillus sydowii CBS 593.65 TaxID=1036612 RepID=A0A1L9TMM4_9EURO|nr:uncharacterized protein ASPSYDRAFT_738533 [Aspergillus sydowii CBS 593.65]OJJ60543.1 hypothetical protein ASPSYDRAFT_738533 [Aspergillus sydowii CBS 593.65]